MFNKKPSYLIIIFSSILGFITSLSLPPNNIIFLNFFTFPLIFLLIEKNQADKKITFLIGWSFGFGYFVSNLYWITNSLTFIEEFKFLIPLAIILIPTILSIFYGLIAIVISFLKIERNLSSLLLFAAIFSIFEYLRGILFSGFPWNLHVFSLTEFHHQIQILSIIGTYSLNLFCITFFLLPLILKFHSSERLKILITVLFGIIVCTNFVYGKLRTYSFENIVETKLKTKFKIISPNINLNRFLENEDPIIRISDVIKLSGPEKDNNIVFIFPEGMLSGFDLENLKNINFIFKENFSKKHNLIFGVNLVEDENVFNTLIVFDSDFKPLDIYRKNKLVPFGEYLPLEIILSKLGFKKITQGYKSFTNSKERKIIKIGDLSLLPLICYEIIYTGSLKKNNKDYDVIVNISEDGWFGDTIGPEQHFKHSIFRSIEEGKNLLRSSNNGISAHIDPTGIVVEKVESTKSGVIEINSLKFVEKTIFSKYGNKIFFYFIIIYITLIFFLKKKGQ